MTLGNPALATVTLGSVNLGHANLIMALVVQGMDIGRSELVLHVRVCEGLMRQLDGTVEKRFAKKEILYPLQVQAHCLSIKGFTPTILPVHYPELLFIPAPRVPPNP